MNSSLLKCGLLLFAFGATTVLQSPQLQAQIDGGGVDGGVIDDGFGGLTGGGGGGTSTGAGDGETVDLDGAASLDLGGLGEDNRNQGFIGATAPGVVENNFVGATSQTFGALAEDATFGGGVNDGFESNIPSGGGGGGGGAGNAGGGQGGAGGFAGASSGSVIRSSIRTRLRPAFAAPVVRPEFTEFNFNENLSRQPSAQSLVGRYQVYVQNKTATVTGMVNSRADADRLIRQLRLQPGIYEIVNQLQVVR